MLTKVRSWLTYPHVASTVALFLALTGGAFALQGKNTVDSGDIQKNAVRSSDIKSPNGVKSGDVKDNGLKGTDIDESTLGKVPSASNADNATNAQNATNAENATNAQNAANAQALSGNTIVAEGDIDGPGALTNSDCLGVNKAVPGVQPGDHVVLTPPNGWPTYEINLTARVTADTVTYTICNQSGGLANFGFAPPLRFLVFR